MPGAALDPAAHRLLSFALAKLGDKPGSGREAIMSRLSVLSDGPGGTRGPSSEWPTNATSWTLVRHRASGSLSTAKEQYDRYFEQPVEVDAREKGFE